jgi:hypothetical protein
MVATYDAPARGQRVDREAGIIRGVRVCGLQSDNGRRYLPGALRRALPLYEGAKVKVNHPQRPGQERPISDTIGWLKDVQSGPDGALYGDLYLLMQHPLAESICEIAERNPSLLGLSHNADAQTRTERDGTVTILEITAVRSVDLVDTPATNASLFESRGTRSRWSPAQRLCAETGVQASDGVLRCLETCTGDRARRRFLQRLRAHMPWLRCDPGPLPETAFEFARRLLA